MDVELPFLTGPLPKDRKEEKEDMLDQLVPPKKREEDKTYATKRFEERFRFVDVPDGRSKQNFVVEQ